MAVIPVRIFGDPGLKRETKEITEFNDDLKSLVKNMIDTMHAYNGVGLAANQIGISKRIFVYEAEDINERGVVANPVIDFYSEETQDGDEGCLSVPGLFYPTKRAMSVKLHGQDIDGNPIELEGSGLLARIFQHETDHLYGTLYIDKIEKEYRRDCMRRVVAGELEQNQLPMME